MQDQNASTQKHLDQMNSSRRANMALNVVDEHFKTLWQGALASLMGNFRMGKTPDELYQNVSQLVGLDDLRAKLNAEVRKGIENTKGTHDA